MAIWHDLYNANVKLQQVADAYYSTTPDAAKPTQAEYTAALQAATALLVQMGHEGDAYVATLPPVPEGYYIAHCPDPEGGCIGWHCYQHSVEEDPMGGTHKPTPVWGYCDGGAPITLDWRAGRLTAIPTPD